LPLIEEDNQFVYDGRSVGVWRDIGRDQALSRNAQRHIGWRAPHWLASAAPSWVSRGDDLPQDIASKRPVAANDRFGSLLGLSRVHQVVLNQSHFFGHRSRLYAIRHVQRLEERGNMDLDGFLRETKLPTDFLVRTAFAKQPQHLALPDS
jgi:hypothetical protein